MIPPGTISRAKSRKPGAEYAALRAEAIRRVQTMSGDIWTDYNFSDPGVTIIEQLCYALTELPYRASFPVADLLCVRRTDRVELRRQGLFSAASILPCNPVAANDFRRIVLDRVAGVANVWFTPREDDSACPISGLYDVAILPGPAAIETDRDEDRLISRVRHCYTAHRALCEDIGAVTILDPIETIVHGRIEIGNEADPSDTLADALFALGLTLAPEPRRMSLDEKQAVDPESTDVFAGPLMLRGFIDDGELQPFPSIFTADQLIEVLAEVDGVLTVDHLAVQLRDDRHRFTGAHPIPVPDNCALRLRTTPEHGHFTIRMFRNHARCEPDAGRVRRRLAERWKQQRRTYPLRTEYAETYGIPKARYWDLEAYTSVQDQFPPVYGIGRGGLPPSPTASRSAQAKQLKGYLMPFDQMLADAFSQIAFIRQLFSIEAGGNTTYACQSLRDIVPNVNRLQLLRPDYEMQLEHLVAETDPVATRRNMILDLLLSFYALDLTPPDGVPGDPREAATQAETLIVAKQTLLRHAATVTRDRGRGADYLRPASSRRMARAELLSCIELDLLDQESGEQHDIGRGAGPTPVDNPDDASFGLMLPQELWTSVERLFREVDVDIDDDPLLAEDRSLLAGERIAADLLDGLLDPDGYRIGVGTAAEGLVLVCRGADGRWWLLAEFDSERQALRMARALQREARRHHRRTRGKHLYLVDWILLRHAMAAGDANGCRYNFRISAVLGTTADERDAPGWKAQATAILRDNIPAHVVLDCLFLDTRMMDHFDELYDAWTRALRHGPRLALAETSRRLEHFLMRHGPRPAPEGEQDAPGVPADDADPATGAGEPPATPEPAADPATSEAPVAPLSDPVVAEAPDTQTVAPDPPPTVAEHAPSGFWSRLWALFRRLLRALLFWRQHDAPAVPASGSPALPPLPPLAPAIPSGGTQVVAAPAGAIGFDTDSVLTAASVAAFRAAGFSFAIRYLSRTTPETSGDLSAAEVATIHNGGLALMAVQHVRSAGWQPSGVLGAQYGHAAAANAIAIGLPAGVSIWLDLEGVATGTAASDIIAYCNTWFFAVAHAGYRPGLYVGANCGLTSAQLGTELDCRFYWQSGSSVPAVSGRAYCMVQTIDKSDVIDGVAYDRDLIQADDHGDTPFWYAPQATGDTP
jgi:hypothetical protein